MHIFVTGGSGLTGPAIIAELLAAGHTVLGLARSDQAAARLRALGAETLRGSLEELDSLREGARATDGVIHMAFGGSFGDPDDLIRRDVTAIETLGRALVGSGKPFVSTSGTLVMAAGHVSTEQDAPDPASLASFRIPGEQACLAFAEQDVRSSVVRLAPTVHGPGDYGFIPALIAAARRTGVSTYIGDGANRWPAIHRLDAASLFRLAIEKAPPVARCTAPARVRSPSRRSRTTSGGSSGSPPPLRLSKRPPPISETRSWPGSLPLTCPPPAPTPRHCWAGRRPIRRCLRTWKRGTTSPHKPPDHPPIPIAAHPRDRGPGTHTRS